MPLRYALEEFKQERDRLLTLLSCLNKAAKTCDLLDSFIAVSYTHLDVYKRQVLNIWRKLLSFPTGNLCVAKSVSLMHIAC